MLNTLLIKNLRVDKTTDFSDENGLQLRVTPRGKKSWTWRKTINGRAIRKPIGSYPEISLKEARRMALQLGGELIAKTKTVPGMTETIADVYPRWFEEKSKRLKHPKKIAERFKLHILPVLGKYFLAEINDSLLRRKYAYMEEADKIDTLRRVITTINELLRWCVSEGLLDRVKTEYALSRFAPKPAVKHRPAVDPDDLKLVFQSVSDSPYLRWCVYSMLRPKENAGLKFEWIDWDKELLTIPASEMKMNKPHTIPLSRQMMELLKQQQKLCIELGFINGFVFPSSQSSTGHLGTTALSDAFRRAKLTGICTVHGLRATARTWMAREHVKEDVAEACLAHSSGNATVEAYNREQFLFERKKVMQRWCDYVDEQRENARMSL